MNSQFPTKEFLPPFSSKRIFLMRPWAICKSPRNNFLFILIFLLKSKLRRTVATHEKSEKKSLKFQKYPFLGFQVKASLCQ